MSASPSTADVRTNRWKKRKAVQSNLSTGGSKRQRTDEEDDEEDEDEEPAVEEEEEDEELDDSPAAAAAADPAADSGAHESEVLTDCAIRMCDFPLVVRHTVNRPHSSVLALAALDQKDQSPEPLNPMFLENISHGQFQALSSIPANSPILAQPDQERSDGSSMGVPPAPAYVCTPPPIMEGKGIIRHFGNQLPHVMPMHSDWFSLSTVHRLERQVVPHFFSRKSADHTPERYMEARNRILAKYMENPERRLSVAECQGLVEGVSDHDLTRIVRFLDSWGIINYIAPVHQRCKIIGNEVLREDVNGEVNVPSAFLKSSIDCLIHFEKPKSRLRPEDVASLGSGVEISDLDSRIRERLAENHCSCCARPLPDTYYQSQKEADIMICLDCFHDGNFVAGNSSIDFLKVDPTKDSSDLDGDSWTDPETLLLLEALELYSDNWNDIAEHVGTKSKAQCILHFIRLPMEGGLLENIELPHKVVSSDVLEDGCRNPNSNPNGNSEDVGPPDQDAEKIIPFANSGNPVMALVAFLASAVGPRVAAACAHAALGALSEDDHPSILTNGATQVESSTHSDGSSSENVHKESGSHGAITPSHQQTEEGSSILTLESVKAAAKSGLSAAATKAKLFADHEEREIQRFVAAIVNNQLKRLELKLKQFAEVETILLKECEQVERARQRIAAERARILSSRFGPVATTQLGGIGVANTGNSMPSNIRQPGITASVAQANLSVSSTNQTTRPHIPFIPRHQQQQMFGFGPRLPLSSINPSSSTPPTSLMPASAPLSNPSLCHPTLRPLSGNNRSLG